MSKLTTLLSLLLISSISFAAESDISGKWDATFDTDVGRQHYTFVFKVIGASLTGTAKEDSAQLEENKITNGKVTFFENITYNGNRIRIQYVGDIVSHGEIKFTRQVGNYGAEYCNGPQNLDKRLAFS